MLGAAYRDPDPKTRAAGFSLIELLVVVACITMLVGILMPGLRSARQRARESTCASRLRQWGLAFGYYAASNRDYWPHCDGLDREDPDPDDPDTHPPNAPPWQVANWHGWVDMLPPLLGFTRWRYYPRNAHPDHTTFYQCPSGELLNPSLYDYNPVRNGYFSYAMNSCLELDQSAWPPPGGEGYPMPSFLNTGKIVWPAQVIVLFDQLLEPTKGFDGNHEYSSAGQYCGSYPIAFAARHRRGGDKLGGNILFADGHVNWQARVWKDWWGEWDIYHQQSPPREDANWYPYPLPEGR